jgi:hypothetical protein
VSKPLVDLIEEDFDEGVLDFLLSLLLILRDFFKASCYNLSALAIIIIEENSENKSYKVLSDTLYFLPHSFRFKRLSDINLSDVSYGVTAALFASAILATST